MRYAAASCCLIVIGACCASRPGTTPRREPGRAPEETRHEAPRLRAECILTAEAVEELLAAAARDERGEDDRLRELLGEHELEHGWNFWVRQPDYVEPEDGVRCSDALLDRMAELRSGAIQVWHVRQPGRIALHFASALARSGRAEQALALIDRVLATGAFEAAERDPLMKWIPSQLIDCATEISEQSGDLERALRYREAWFPGTWCAEASDNARELDLIWRESLLLRLDRASEFSALIRESLYEVCAPVLADGIEAWLARGRGPKPEQALDALIVLAGPGRVSPLGRKDALRLWELRRAPQAEREQHLAELAVLDRPLAWRTAFAASDRALLALADAFDIVDGELRDEELAEVLAATGRECLVARIEAVHSALGEEEFLSGAWNHARANLAVLSVDHASR